MKKNLEKARVFVTVEEDCADVTIEFENFNSVDMKIDLEKFESFDIKDQDGDELEEYAISDFRSDELPENFLNYVLKYGDRFDEWGYKVSYFDADKNRRVKNPEKRILGGSSMDVIAL